MNALPGDSSSLEDYIPIHASDCPHDAYNQLSESIPCIDLADFRKSDDERREKKLQEFRRSVSDWGFFKVIGHGVDVKLIGEMRAWIWSVFQMPLDKKLKIDVPAGYECGLKKSTKKRQWQESLLFRSDPRQFDAIAAAIASSPEESAYARLVLHLSFQQILSSQFMNSSSSFVLCRDLHRRFSEALEHLASETLRLLAQSLGLQDTEFFSRYWEQGEQPLMPRSLRFAHYPPCDRPELVAGTGAHTDPTLITLLHEDDVGGLQILKGNDWVVCKPQTDAIVVNIGDYLQVLSNDVFPSVQHQVAVNRSRSRMSVALFVLPRDEKIVEPCPQLVDAAAGRPPQFRAFRGPELRAVSAAVNYGGRHALSHFREK